VISIANSTTSSTATEIRPISQQDGLRREQNGRRFAVTSLNKQLDVSFNTFRDKLQPGADEKWNVTIKGNKGEKVAAEMVASMYDASLDQFKPHNWNVPNLWQNNSYGANWNGNLNFIQQQGRVKYWYEQMGMDNVQPKMYDRLLSLNQYGFNQNIRIRGAGSLAGRVAGVQVQSEDYDKSSLNFAAAPMAMRSLNDVVVVACRRSGLCGC